MTLINGSNIRVNKGVCHFDVASGPFKCHFDVIDMARQYYKEYIYMNDGLGYLSVNSRNMSVGLLKCPNGSLESVQHPSIPWPRYSRKLTFWH